MFFVIVSNDDYWKIFATRVDCAEQRHPMRSGFKIDHDKIKISADSTDNLHGIVRAVRQVTETTGLHEDLCHGILQLWIIRQKK
jgi:hypothetical protein